MEYILIKVRIFLLLSCATSINTYQDLWDQHCLSTAQWSSWCRCGRYKTALTIPPPPPPPPRRRSWSTRLSANRPPFFMAAVSTNLVAKPWKKGPRVWLHSQSRKPGVPKYSYVSNLCITFFVNVSYWPLWYPSRICRVYCLELVKTNP